MARHTGHSPTTPAGRRGAGPPPDTVGDPRWRADTRHALCYGLGFAALTAALDWASGGLTPARADVWLALGGLLFSVLRPPRVTAGPGWLAVRGLVRTHRVRTDALTGVQLYDGPAPRLVLRDADGGHVAFDARVLSAAPLLWHALETGARRSAERGTLRYGAWALRRLARRIDGGTARAVLRASGLE
ncbi:hypothetical protein RKE29_26550 [Streptomyces sp. B1866]|uniref:hypothetical protein n=1 Tax=Streptomyces sp. B1866 TaxID=3075431 RepID=UPI00288FC897|nr:hypothetical protein [Streptomyces sp. B1866]MDT3400139.1 hypothetical protein [Streptomyces sp. B1866]